jgi:hypothetical protein
MDESSLDLAIDVLGRFVAFLETLTPAELEAVAALRTTDGTDVEGFGLAEQYGVVGGEASFEYMIGLSGKLARGDNAANINQMHNQLDGLKAAKGRAASFRWPP